MHDSESLEVLKRIESLLNQLVRVQLGPILRAELETDFDRHLYEMTGEATARQIQARLKCGPNRVCEKWNKWEGLGLVIKDGQGYRKAM